jgi:hypothetical protein
MRRAVRSAALLATSAALLAACATGGDPAGPTDRPAGTYTLRTVAGQRLPVPLTADAGSGLREITSEVLTLRGDGTFTRVAALRVTGAGVAAVEHSLDAGTWTADGAQVVLRIGSAGPEFTGALAGARTLTLTRGGLTFVYER